MQTNCTCDGWHLYTNTGHVHIHTYIPMHDRSALAPEKLHSAGRAKRCGTSPTPEGSCLLSELFRV